MNKATLIFVSICLMALVLLQIRADHGFTWEPSYEATSTDPLGSKVFYEWLGSTAEVSTIQTHDRLLVSLPTLDTSVAVVIITDRFDPDAGSRAALFTFLRNGGSVVLATRTMADSLERMFEIFSTVSYRIEDIRDASDTLKKISLSNELLSRATAPRSSFRWMGDTTGLYGDAPEYGPWQPLITTTDGLMISGKRTIGAGELSLTLNPQLLTNHAMLYGKAWLYTELVVSHWPNKPLVIDHHYKPKRSSQQGLLFTITQYRGLGLAYYTVLITSLAFVLLGIRRLQRPIPPVEPLINTSIEYVRTIAQMYRVGDTRRSVAGRIVDQFDRLVRRRTGIRLGVDPERADIIARSLGEPEEEIAYILLVSNAIRQGTWEASHAAFLEFHHRIQPIINKGTL